MTVPTRPLARLPGNAGDVQTQRRINSAFLVARSLHSNFYEDKIPEDAVRAGLLQCEELSARLYELFWPEGRSLRPTAPKDAPRCSRSAFPYGGLPCRPSPPAQAVVQKVCLAHGRRRYAEKLNCLKRNAAHGVIRFDSRPNGHL